MRGSNNNTNNKMIHFKQKNARKYERRHVGTKLHVSFLERNLNNMTLFCATLAHT